MTDASYDRAPGEISITPEAQERTLSDFAIYTVGLTLAVLLTATSFWVANTSLLWPPGIPIGLVVLAIAQMGVGLLPAHYHRTRQHQQRAGAGVWHAYCVPRRCRVALDHDKSE
jgi:heme/copper-type cytochrome/quinol oxidase subunit 4